MNGLTRFPHSLLHLLSPLFLPQGGDFPPLLQCRELIFMWLSEPVSGSHVASATGAVLHYIPPPPNCSPLSPISDLISSSQANPSSIPTPPFSSIPFSAPAPPAVSAVGDAPDPAPTSHCGGPSPDDPSLLPSPSVPPPPVHHNPRSASSNPNSSSAGHHSSSAGPVPPCLGQIASNPAPFIQDQGPPPPLPIPPSMPRSLPAGRSSSLSYAQAARGPRGPGFVRSHAADVESFARLPRTGVNIVCGSREGAPSFSFVSSDLPKVEELYSNALVMKFFGGRPSLAASHKEILSWGIEKPFSIGPLSSRAFLLRFQDIKDLVRVLSRPSSILITFPYRVFRWHNQCHIKEDSCFAPVWISLPKLPLQCFIPEFLEAVANKIGRFLCFDKATSTLARPSAARMCVELDLRINPPPSIWVGLFEGFKQPVIYERMPKFCSQCLSQGHVASVCPWGQRETLPIQAHPRPDLGPGRPPAARRNASKRSSSNSRMNSTSASFISSRTSHPLNSTVSTTQSEPPPSKDSPQPVVELRPSTHSPSPQDSADPPSVLNNDPHPPSMHPNNPMKSTSVPPSICPTDKHKRNKVTFDMGQIYPQPNVEANTVFWEAVNRQVSILDQAHLTGSPAYQSHHSTSRAIVPNPAASMPSSSNTKLHTKLPSTSDSESSLAADSPSPSPPSSPHGTQKDVFSLQPSSYYSEGEDPVTEEACFQGHCSDDMSSAKPKSSKRNKRHPDQPLIVQLRVRKDKNPSAR